MERQAERVVEAQLVRRVSHWVAAWALVSRPQVAFVETVLLVGVVAEAPQSAFELVLAV